jgi:hypothetical protein
MPNDPSQYCREIETYLCRKNDGHLIRIVGPVFERVCGWADRGVPLKVVFRGIDRYFERYYARGPRRRPVRVEFCEADVLDVFDEWRRAVGLTHVHLEADVAGGPDRIVETAGGRGRGLNAHLDRVVSRLQEAHMREGAGSALGDAIDRLLSDLVPGRGPKPLRGQARAAFLERLVDLDAALLAAAREAVGAEVLTAIRREAEEELAPFRSRLADMVFRDALHACENRLLRQQLRLPTVSFQGGRS